MILTPSTRLGSYEITSLLGSGRMGQVYRAKDLKLGRDVAIKVLREEAAADPGRLTPFEPQDRSLQLFHLARRSRRHLGGGCGPRMTTGCSPIDE